MQCASVFDIQSPSREWGVTSYLLRQGKSLGTSMQGAEEEKKQATHHVSQQQEEEDPQKEAADDDPFRYFGEAEDEEIGDLLTIHHVGQAQRVAPISVIVQIEKKPCSFEIDTGASVSQISEAGFKKLWSRKAAPGLRRASTRFCTYTGQTLDCWVNMMSGVGISGPATQVAVVGNGPSLLGRNWLSSICLNWAEIVSPKESSINHTQAVSPEQARLESKFADVFQDGLGLLRGTVTSVRVQNDAKPRFFKPRPVPYARRPLVEVEIRRLKRAGVIEPVHGRHPSCP
eukprot:m.271760 g.271760  ORF g.271760 m.271760 type:complete len:287 (+) comp40553_c0_seq3:1-861(+)